MSQMEAARDGTVTDRRRGPERRWTRRGTDRRQSARTRRAGLRMSFLFALLPPAVGVTLGGLLLTHPDRVPWVLAVGFLVALVSFVLVPPLGRRSRGFSVTRYRRATELAVLVGLCSGVVVLYTLVVYLLLGVRTPWVLVLLERIGLG